MMRQVGMNGMRTIMAAALVAASLSPAVAFGQKGPVLTPEQAAAVLWQAKAADEKCRALKPADHDALIGLAASAEIAAARDAGADAATAALSKGRRQGEGMPCDAGTAAFISGVFAAAGAAYAAAETGAPAEQRPRAGFALFAGPPQQPGADAAPPEPLPKIAPGDIVGRFRVNTAAYLVEVRCGHLGAAAQRRFYEAMVAEQKRLAAGKGRSAAGRAKAEAEALAKAQGACGRNTQALVRARYSDAVSGD